MTKLLSLLALCAALILFMSACQDNISPNLEESLDLFAGLEVIPEAQQTNVTINKGTAATDGYFTISVAGVDANPFLAPGTHEAWCLEWNKNLRSNNDVHQEVKWFSTGDNDTWKPLNYLFSIRGELQASDPDLTFRDLQAVVWVLAGEMGIAPAFDVLNMPVDRIPARLRASDELAIDREKVAGIARRVMVEAPKATGVPAGTVAQTAADQQDIYSPPAIQEPSLNQTVDFEQRTLVLNIHAGANATLEAIEFTSLVNLQIVEVVGGTFSGSTVTPSGTPTEVKVVLAAVDVSNPSFQYFVEITNSRSEVTTYGDIGIGGIDTAARTFNVQLDAGSGNTLTEIDLTGTTGLNATIINGGFGFQSATILFESNGSDSFTFALKAVNDKHQVFDFGQISLTWPAAACADPIINEDPGFKFNFDAGNDATISSIKFNTMSGFVISNSNSFVSQDGLLWTPQTTTQTAVFEYFRQVIEATGDILPYSYSVELTNSCGESTTLNGGGPGGPA